MNIMKIYLGNFRLWRIRKFLLFSMCMLLSGIIGLCVENCVWLFIGLVIYGVIIDVIDLDVIKEVNIYKEGPNLVIKGSKTIEICLDEIDKIYITDIRYGGKRIDVIGYRMYVITKGKKYTFDSVPIQKDKVSYKDLFQLEKYIRKLIHKSA